MKKAKKFNEFVLLMTEPLRNLLILKILITINNQELGSWFLSLQ